MSAKFVLPTLASVIVMTALQSNAAARNAVYPQEDLAAASNKFVGKLKQFSEQLEKRPAKVESNQWKSIKEGAAELKSKATRLRAQIAALQKSADGLGVENGSLQARLDVLVSEFQRLADEAGQTKDLPEPLASVVIRERNLWLNWVSTTQNFSEHYKGLILDYQKHLEQLKLVDPVLARIEKGGGFVNEVASVGEQLESAGNLQTFADEINAILDEFDSLNDQTKAAIAQANPAKVMQLAARAGSVAGHGVFNVNRTWTSVEGRSFSGKLLDVSGNVARIKGEKDGRVYKVPIQRLAEGDRALLTQVDKNISTMLAMN